MIVRIKVCGLTNLPDAQCAVNAGADILGFIFFSESPRAVKPERAREIVTKLVLEGKQPLKVGVFVNEEPHIVAQTLEFCQLDGAQLHGEEPPEILGIGSEGEGSVLRGRAYKALRFASSTEAQMIADKYALPPDLRSERQLPSFLLDSYHAELRGGSGITGDWEMAKALATRYPILLAGGLKPDNVAGAVSLVKPWGVDVASGVEIEPGKKDHAALYDFISIVRHIAEEV